MNNKDNNLDVINNLELDDEFIKKVMKTNTNNEIKELFKTKNLELDDEQIENIKIIFLGNLRELDDTDIKNVTGGFDKNEVKSFAIAGGGFGGIAGMALGAGIGGLDGLTKGIRQKCGIMGTFKVALENAVKACVVGGITGAGFGAIASQLVDIGIQGCNDCQKALKSNKKATNL